MNISKDLLIFSAEYGLVLSLILSAVVLLAWRLDPKIWKNDITRGEEKGNTTGYRSTLLLMILLLTGYCVHTDVQALNLNPRLSQGTLFVINVIMLGLYAIIKFFVIDYLIYSKIKPAFMKIEGVPYETSIFHHLKMMALTIVYGGVFCYLAAIIAVNLSIY